MKNKKVILVCDQCLSRNYRFRFSTNRVNRLELSKYCKFCKKTVIHKETR
ncbi:LSU ribosomal protein L33p [[Mycoplasma] cavipharyngis]